jgi:hypothetical protein
MLDTEPTDSQNYKLERVEVVEEKGLGQEIPMSSVEEGKADAIPQQYVTKCDI